MLAVGENIWKQAKPPVLFDSSRSASVMLGWHVQAKETNLIITEPGHESIARQPVFKLSLSPGCTYQTSAIGPLSPADPHRSCIQPVSGLDQNVRTLLVWKRQICCRVTALTHNPNPHPRSNVPQNSNFTA